MIDKNTRNGEGFWLDGTCHAAYFAGFNTFGDLAGQKDRSVLCEKRINTITHKKYIIQEKHPESKKILAIHFSGC